MGTFFHAQGRWLVSIFIFFAFTLHYRQHHRWHFVSSVLAILFTLGVGILFFTFASELAERYIIMYYPLIYLLPFLVFPPGKPSIISHKPIHTVILIFITALLFISHQHPPVSPTSTLELRPPSDLSYRDMMIVNRKTAIYLQSYYPLAAIYGSFPENIYLTQPYQGYVSRPLTFEFCQNFTYDPTITQIITFHLYAPGQLDCQDLLSQFQSERIEHFQDHAKWNDIYQIIATKSADLTT
jgi:hypothetical protein